MKAGAVIVDLVGKGRLRWQLHEILRRHIEGAIPANADVCAGRLYQGFGLRHDFPLRQGGVQPVEVFGQSITLGNVEHAVAFEKRDRDCVTAFGDGVLLLVFGDETVGIADDLTALTLAHIAAKALGLAVGQPNLGRISLLDHRTPQQQDVDPRIGLAGNRIDRKSDLASGVLAIPWLHPRQAACLKLGNDLVRDGLVEIDLAAALRLRLLFPVLSFLLRHGGLLLSGPTAALTPGSGVGGETGRTSAADPRRAAPAGKGGSAIRETCGLEGGTTGRPGHEGIGLQPGAAGLDLTAAHHAHRGRETKKPPALAGDSILMTYDFIYQVVLIWS